MSLTPAHIRFANQQLRDAAYEIRAELVCCDIYDRDRGTARAGSHHALCFWGEASARLVEEKIIHNVDDHVESRDRVSRELKQIVFVIGGFLAFFHVLGLVIWLFTDSAELLGVALMWDIVVGVICALLWGANKLISK